MIDAHKKILSEIVALDGKCLDPEIRCKACPFASVCLPDFIRGNKDRPSQQERANMAADILARHELLGADDDPQEQYRVHSRRAL